MERVFYTDDGRLYKAEIRVAKSHAEVNFPTGDMLKALTSEPCTREEMIGRINHVEFNNQQAVLAASDEKVLDV